VRLLALAVALCALPSMTCTRQVRTRNAGYSTGTCEGACRHYTSCRGSEDAVTFDSCVRECSDIFVTDGDIDSESLKEFEQLECADAISFVEGASGRAPGQSHAGR